ncbi:unnamed protein product [Closterium sp. NIES-53]
MLPYLFPDLAAFATVTDLVAHLRTSDARYRAALPTDRLMLPYLFPDLAAFATVTDLVAHLRTSDARYRAALPTEFCAKNPPPPCTSPFNPSHPPP